MDATMLKIFLIFVLWQTAEGTSSLNDLYTNWRLPTWFKPRFYQLQLLPFIELGNFTGSVHIQIQCIEESSLIILHMADIDIVNGTLEVQDIEQQESVPIESYEEDKVRQFLMILLKNTTTFGKFYKISMQFIGKLNDNLHGFYRSSYFENGVKKYLATTQFSPADARRAFPCFDEPSMKARFQITLGRQIFQLSHSNMPINKTVSNELLPGYVWDHYETTLPMSTYILAFLVHEFQGDINRTDIFNIWSRPSARKQTEYAKLIGPGILKYFENYFNIEFPLPKLDMFAIPDFAVGAMENWGLITYRETSLLYDPNKSSALNKQRVAIVVAHELAHQWFGNLVTMHWWSDLWLKEGFASYLEYVGTNAVERKMHIHQQFTVIKMQEVFDIDSLSSSHAMSLTVNKRNDINELFDSIPYAKGPSVIRMLADFLGHKTFRAGLSLYLNNKKYENAHQRDLWQAMTQQSAVDDVFLPENLETIMNTWSLQTGYPIVTIVRNYKDQTATLQQERFYMLPTDNSSQPLWWIPVTLTNDYQSIYQAWMGNSTVQVHLSSIDSKDWLVMNVDQIGYYRVNYDTNNWNLIIEQLRNETDKISALNRAQLLDDAFNIARAGILDYSIAFELSRYLVHEKEFAPWKSALNAFRYIDRMLYATPQRQLFRDYVRTLIEPVFKNLGYESSDGDSHLSTLNRDQILKWACRLNISECINYTTSVYGKWMENRDKVLPVNYRTTIMCAAVANGGDVEWNFAYEQYQMTNVASEKDAYLLALSCSGNAETLTKLLQWSLDGNSSQIRRQDARATLTNIASNPIGQQMVFQFILENWNDMVLKFPSLYVLGRIVDSITLTLNTESDLNELIELSQGSRGDLGTAARSVNQAIERTRVNVNWMDSHYHSINQLLNIWI